MERMYYKDDSASNQHNCACDTEISISPVISTIVYKDKVNIPNLYHDGLAASAVGGVDEGEVIGGRGRTQVHQSTKFVLKGKSMINHPGSCYLLPTIRKKVGPRKK